MEIVVMKNDLITSKGKAILMLCSEDYQAYCDKMKDKIQPTFNYEKGGFEPDSTDNENKKREWINPNTKIK